MRGRSSSYRVSWWSRRSLRTRLTAATAAVLAIGMVTAAGVLVWRLQASLTQALDAAAEQQAQTVAGEVESDRLPRTLPDAGDGVPIVQVVDASGSVLAQSENLKESDRLFSFAGGDDPVVYSAAASDDGDDDDHGVYRVAALRVRHGGSVLTVYAALPVAGVSQSVGALTAALIVGVPLIVAVLAVLAWMLVGRALQPVEALRRQAAAIPASELSRRLTTPAAGDELGRLAGTLNDLLTRIEASADQQRRFVADAAHELRSPIAAMRAQLEVAARHPDAVTAEERVQALLADIRRLSRLVDDLLALARIDSGAPSRRDAVDVDDLVLQEARRTLRRQIRISTAGVSAGRVLGEPTALARVVRNLLDNAVRHAASQVTVRLQTEDGLVTLSVADDGDGISPADRERVFERFTRLDEARARDAGGAGLGLAIVAEIVRTHGGAIRIEDGRPGAVLIVTLPEGG